VSGGREVGAEIPGGGGPLLAWGCLQLLLGAGLAVWTGGTPSLLLIGGSTPVLVLAAWNRVRRPRERPRLVPLVSMPVVIVAVGLAAMAVGLTAGLWLVLVGGEIVAFGAVWLARELRDERRALR
jgi:hypothetical protein